MFSPSLCFVPCPACLLLCASTNQTLLANHHHPQFDYKIMPEYHTFPPAGPAVPRRTSAPSRLGVQGVPDQSSLSPGPDNTHTQLPSSSPGAPLVHGTVASADETTAIVAEGDTTSPDMRHIEDGLVGSAFTAEAYNETNALRAPDGIQLHVPMMICWFLYFIILLWNSITGTNSFWLMVPVTVLSWIGPGVLCLFQQPTTGDLYSTLYGLYSTIYDWHLVLFGFLPYVNCLFKVEGGPAKRIPVVIIICWATFRSAYCLYRK